MNDKKITDHEIEQLLRNMPMIEDTRSKEEIYTKVMNRIDRDEYMSSKKMKKKWLWPKWAAIASLFFIFIVSFSLFYSEKRQRAGK